MNVKCELKECNYNKEGECQREMIKLKKSEIKLGCCRTKQIAICIHREGRM